MRPIHFEGANVTYHSEGCGHLPAQKDDKGVMTVWVPEDGELGRVKDGQLCAVVLKVAGDQPPVALEITGLTPVVDKKSSTAADDSSGAV